MRHLDPLFDDHEEADQPERIQRRAVAEEDSVRAQVGARVDPFAAQDLGQRRVNKGCL